MTKNTVPYGIERVSNPKYWHEVALAAAFRTHTQALLDFEEATDNALRAWREARTHLSALECDEISEKAIAAVHEERGAKK